VGITALVPDRWGSPWESRHQLLTRLAKYFNVLWVNPVGYVRHLPRILRDYRPLPVRHEAALPPGFRVFRRGYLLPRFYKQCLGEPSDRARLAAARLMLRRRGARRHVLYLWRDQFDWALERGRYDLSLYHIDDEYTFSPHEVPLGDRERRVIEAVDLVAITSPGLMRRKGHLNPRTIRVPNGVDFAAFAASEAAAAEAPEPEDLAGIPHPRVGYSGVIKRQLDIDILQHLARARPQVSFVFVGPYRRLGQDIPRWEAFRALPNVHLLGEKHFSELPRYVRGLDVCLLCYRKTAYTDQIYPLKLHEYLATGKPVVATPLESFEEFADHLLLARSAEAWPDAVDAALAERDPARAAARREVARRHDWDRLARNLAGEICSSLGGDHLARLQRACEMLGEEAAPAPPPAAGERT
jgi:glycosyltransferase involved in cell wall biosynthesis